MRTWIPRMAVAGLLTSAVVLAAPAAAIATTCGGSTPFTSLPVRNVRGTPVQVSSVVAASSDEAWAAGNGPRYAGDGFGLYVSHLTDGVFRPEPLMFTLEGWLDGITLAGGHPIAVGTRDTSSGHPRTVAIIRSHGGWTRMDTSAGDIGGGTHLVDVDARSASDVYAIGTQNPRGKADPIVLHWNGAHWRWVDVSAVVPAGSSLTSVDVAPGGDVWITGAFNILDGNVYVLHGSGAGWAMEQIGPMAPAETEWTMSVAARTAGDVWVVGQTYDDTVGGRPIYHHWDGATWTTVTGPYSDLDVRFEDVAVRADGSIVVVGFQDAMGVLVSGPEGAMATPAPDGELLTLLGAAVAPGAGGAAFVVGSDVDGGVAFRDCA